MRKEKLTKFEGLLKLIGTRKNLNAISSKISSNPKDILNLIRRCEELIKEIKSGDSVLVSELLAKLSKLRLILLNLLKRRQEEILNLYWQKIQEENKQFSKNMRKRLIDFRKQIAS